MTESTQFSNLVSAIVANVNNALLILLFVARINKMPKIEYWIGIIFILSIIPLTYLFVTALESKPPFIYFIQLGFMMTFLIVELLLDYIFKVDFRHTQRLVIPYVILFFAGTGGMIGVASHAGKFWTIVTIITFLGMAVSSFIMHAMTGQ